jgi:hypothetical protein
VNGAYQYSVNTGGGSRIEYWKIQVYSLPLGGTVRFAVFYKNVDWGTEYWDNDFSQDYSQALVSGNQMH